MGKKLTNEEFIKRVYDKFGDDVTILDEYVNRKTNVNIYYHPLNTIGSTTAEALLLGMLPKEIKDATSYRKDKVLSQEKFENKVYKNNPNIKLGVYIGATQPIECKCLLCKNIWYPRASALTSNKTGCPFCAGQKAIKNVNDLWTTRPDIASLLKHSNEGYTLMENSHKKVTFICPDCGEENIKELAKVTLRGLSCSSCSDGISYPNKFLFDLLKQLHIEFETEYSPTWIGNRYFDFYIPSMQTIIEMDGGLGHGKTVFANSNITVEETIKSDNYKDELAKKHNIQVIRIDADVSQLEYLKRSIINKLYNLFDLSNISWEQCDANATKSIIKEICYKYCNDVTIDTLSSEYKLCRGTIINYLHRGNLLGLCKYEPSNIRYSKSVKCLNTNEVFNTIKDARDKYNAFNISRVCSGMQKSSGKHPVTGEPLKWVYYNSKEGDKIA